MVDKLVANILAETLMPVVMGRTMVQAFVSEERGLWDAVRIDGPSGRMQKIHNGSRADAVELVGEAICTQADLNRGNWVEGEA